MAKATDELIKRFPTIVDLLEHFKPLFLEDFTRKCLGWSNSEPILKLPEVLVVLPRMKPRLYSISSSNKVSPSEVSITVGVLTVTTTAGKTIEGVCSHYLAGLVAGTDRAQVTVAKSSFRLPPKVESPLLLVGAGTGLDPMIGFLEERSLDQEGKLDLGPIHLFIGCRTDHDYIYKECIEEYEQEKLICCHLALSRCSQDDKKYVQHRLLEMGKQLYDLLQNPETCYYVCGDARMANSCFEACVQILQRHGPMSRVLAVQHLKATRLEGRWQADVWGIVSHFEEAKKSVQKRKRAAAQMWLKQLEGGEVKV